MITALALATFCLALTLHAPASALECAAPADWTERTICGSDELTRLDRSIARTDAALVAAADPRFRSALADHATAWRRARDTCRKEDYPQACMERRHYARVDTLASITALVVGPRLWGNPLRGCWQHSETEDDAQACLDAKLADAMTGLAIAGAGVREALGARDRAPGAAGDSLALFEAAWIAFAAHEAAACRAEAAALGQGRGRELGGTACRIALVRGRAVEILGFMPDLAAPWTAGIRSSRKEIDACLGKTGSGAVVGLARMDGRLRLRIETSAGGRQDCTADGTTVQSLTPVTDGDRTPDEGLAAYIPGAGPVQSPECGLVEPITDAAGALTGHLVVTGC